VTSFLTTLYLMRWPLLTIACMLAIAYVTRYSGMDATLGLAFTHTGVPYPFFAAMLGRVWTLENVPQQILETFLTVSESPIVLLLMANLFLLVVGMFMEDVSGILLAAPLLMPVMQLAEVNPIHFSAIVATNLGMGLITPPTAPILYFAALIGKVPLARMLSPTLVFVFLAYFPVVLLTTFLPELSMTLPRLALGLP